VSSDSEQSDDDRDQALLRQIALARQRDDGALREQILVAKLLSRHRANIARIVRWRAHSLRPSSDDVDDIVGGVLRRLATALEHKLEFGKPFRWVVADNVGWEVTDFARQRTRRARLEQPDGPELAEPAAFDGPTLEAEARDLTALLASLSDRERVLLTDQMLFGFDAEQTGERHGMNRGAVYTATHRALKKLFDADELSEARAEHQRRAARRHAHEGADGADAGDPGRAVRDPGLSSEGEV
jgi:DNA-directed RNA polymerase specialized sigma24 family protein